MNRKELKNKIESKEEELLKLKEELENIPVGNFENNVSSSGFCINSYGVCRTRMYLSSDIINNYNAFTNEEYAKEVAYKQWFERKLLAYKDEHEDKCDWSDDDKYKFSCYLLNGNINIEFWNKRKDLSPCFNSKELLQKHIDENNREWIKYFNVCKELD